MQMLILTFDGPRTEEQVRAAEHASRQRIMPLLDTDPDLAGVVGTFRAVGPDGAQAVVVLARDAATLATLRERVTTSPLLPGEDPALLPGPDRIAELTVADATGACAHLGEVAS